MLIIKSYSIPVQELQRIFFSIIYALYEVGADRFSCLYKWVICKWYLTQEEAAYDDTILLLHSHHTDITSRQTEPLTYAAVEFFFIKELPASCKNYDP
jgi:hypothetical protein